MPRDKRPEDIQVLDDLVDEVATPEQKEIIPFIRDHPQMPFTTMEKRAPEELDLRREYSDSHYSDVYYRYFGPADDKLDRSFNEIKEKYGTISNYYRNRYELDDIPDPDEDTEDAGEDTRQAELDINASDVLGNSDAGDETALPEEQYQMLKRGIKLGFELGYKFGREDRGR